MDLSLDPTEVERASRRERVRRNVWMVATTILSATAVVASILVARAAGAPPGLGPVVLAWFVLDLKLFSWGFDRFDLVAPWQFREAAGEDGDPDD